MKHQLDITRVVLSDIDSVYDLICDLEKNTFEKVKFKSLFDQNVANPDLIYLVARFENKIIGFIGVHIQGLLHHCSRVAEIQELVINVDYRGKNVGQELIRAAEKICSEQGIVEIEVTSNKKNERAHQFYMNNNYSASHFKFTRKLK